MKLAIVTDSTAYLNERIRNHKDLFIIPIPVIIDDQPFEEGVDIGYEEFYQKLKTSKDFPRSIRIVSLNQGAGLRYCYQYSFV